MLHNHPCLPGRVASSDPGLSRAGHSLMECNHHDDKGAEGLKSCHTHPTMMFDQCCTLRWPWLRCCAPPWRLRGGGSKHSKTETGVAINQNELHGGAKAMAREGPRWLRTRCKDPIPTFVDLWGGVLPSLLHNHPCLAGRRALPANAGPRLSRGQGIGSWSATTLTKSVQRVSNHSIHIPQ